MIYDKTELNNFIRTKFWKFKWKKKYIPFMALEKCLQ